MYPLEKNHQRKPRDSYCHYIESYCQFEPYCGVQVLLLTVLLLSNLRITTYLSKNIGTDWSHNFAIQTLVEKFKFDGVWAIYHRINGWREELHSILSSPSKARLLSHRLLILSGSLNAQAKKSQRQGDREGREQ